MMCEQSLPPGQRFGFGVELGDALCVIFYSVIDCHPHDDGFVVRANFLSHEMIPLAA